MTTQALVPTISIIKGIPQTTSTDIAERFSKRHADVIRSIQNLNCPRDFNERNFALSEYPDSTGRKLPQYHITRDGFTILVMGFAGKRVVKGDNRLVPTGPLGETWRAFQFEMLKSSKMGIAPSSVIFWMDERLILMASAT